MKPVNRGGIAGGFSPPGNNQLKGNDAGGGAGGVKKSCLSEIQRLERVSLRIFIVMNSSNGFTKYYY